MRSRLAGSEEKRAGLRQRQKEATGRLIRDAAYELFEDKGFHETTMRALASHAGVGLGTIFKHFPDKQSLLFAAFTEDLELVIDEAFEELPRTGPLRDQLLGLVKPIFEFYAARPALSRILIKECLFPEGEWAQRLEGAVMTFLGRVGELFQEARARGELSEQLELREGLTAFWSLYFLSLIGGLREPTFDVDRWLETLGDFLDRFIVNR